MASALGNYLAKKILDHVLGGTTYTQPTSVDLALYTAAPDSTGGGTEVTGGGYARQQITNDSTQWNAAAGTTTAAKTKSNKVDFVWAAGPVGAAWNNVTHFVVFEHGNNNMLGWGALTNARSYADGDAAPKFPAGSLVVTMI